MHQLGAAETKLLYTLHWIFLSAADECIDADQDRKALKLQRKHFIFSIPTITVNFI